MTNDLDPSALREDDDPILGMIERWFKIWEDAEAESAALGGADGPYDRASEPAHQLRLQIEETVAPTLDGLHAQILFLRHFVSQGSPPRVSFIETIAKGVERLAWRLR